MKGGGPDTRGPDSGGSDTAVPDVAVIGGGVIGLGVAWRCAQRGMRVTLYDPRPRSGASWVAAGMLAPVTEAHFGEEPLLRLGLASAERWPRFAEELSQYGDLGYRTEGTLLVAHTDDDLRAIERLYRFYGSLGLTAEAQRASQCRERVPLLSPRIRGGMYAPGDHQVDPRRLTAALLRAATEAGVTFRDERVTRLDDVPAGRIVLAAGTGSARLAGLPVHGVNGQVLRLRLPDSSHFGVNVRALAAGRSVYLVPRADGELVVGATMEERGDTTVTAGGVYELLRAAVDVLPEVAEYELTEARAGLRPGTPDNAPLLGPTADPRVVAATGHFRNGILLTPITVDLVAEYLDTGVVPDQMAPFDPSRFTEAARPTRAAAPDSQPWTPVVTGAKRAGTGSARSLAEPGPGEPSNATSEEATR